MGGGAIRTAAKAVVVGGYRTALDAASAARRASSPSTSTITTAATAAEGAPLVSVLSCENDRTGVPVVSGIHSPAWEIDDWVFAGKEEELLDSLHPAPRLVFGPVPTLEEAKAATVELKDAVEKVYFSSSTTSDSTMSGLGASLQSPVCLEGSETEGCAMSKNSTLSSTPNHVIQMFSLLRGNPEAQNVIASVVSDENVWNAVANNPKVKQFYETQQSVVLPSETVVESSEFPESSEAHPSQDSYQSSRTRFMDFVQNIKLKVAKMVANLSDFFPDYMGTSTWGHSSIGTGTHHADSNADVVRKSFVALAIATILVILLKRG
ncbi:Bifunctional protein HldE [Cocos nucifera]|uniref:Bifunctional protein HldE n=1 Tax=Cocos nucifera TaxID=13894 RepID=A0A8K0IBM4_COCNU|nr:Bifunctional protein HldE [Cocos nucifera]